MELMCSETTEDEADAMVEILAKHPAMDTDEISDAEWKGLIMRAVHQAEAERAF